MKCLGAFAAAICFLAASNWSLGGLVLYVSEYHQKAVYKYTNGSGEPVITGLSNPADIAFDANGNLFVADAGEGVIKRASANGAVDTFATGFTLPVGIAADSEGNVFVADNATHTISKVTSSGAVSIFATGLNNAFGMTIGPDDNLYVADRGSGSILKVSKTGGISTYASNLVSLFDLTFTPDGNLFAVTSGSFGSDGVYQIFPNGTSSYYHQGGFLPQGIASDKDGEIYTSSFFEDYIFRIHQDSNSDILAHPTGPRFLLTSDSLPPEISPPAVPEPGTLTLAGMGIAALVGLRWRQRKAVRA